MPNSETLVHRVGPDLDLERLAVERDDRGVERLVAGCSWGSRCSRRTGRGSGATAHARRRARRSSRGRRRRARGWRGRRRSRRTPRSCAASSSRCCRCASGGPESSASMPASRSAAAELLDRPLDVRLAALAPACRAAWRGRGTRSGSRALNARSSSSHLICQMPEALGQRRVDLHRLARDALLLLDAAARPACACCAAGRRA